MLSGYKTYILGGVTIISAIAAFLVGQADAATTITLCVNSALAMFVRNGIATTAAK